jgi:hypothetical protein
MKRINYKHVDIDPSWRKTPVPQGRTVWDYAGILNPSSLENTKKETKPKVSKKEKDPH